MSRSLFPGLKVDGCYQFRITRNSNLYVDDEEVDDLIRALEGQLEASRYGDAVRLEVSHECPEDLQAVSAGSFPSGWKNATCISSHGPVNLNRLATICEIDEPDQDDSSYPPNSRQGLPEELRIPSRPISSKRYRHRTTCCCITRIRAFAPVIDFIASRRLRLTPMCWPFKQ